MNNLESNDDTLYSIVTNQTSKQTITVNVDASKATTYRAYAPYVNSVSVYSLKIYDESNNPVPDEDFKNSIVAVKVMYK